jgi:hypothetical protein
MIFVKIYLIVLEAQFILQILTWVACTITVRSARTNTITGLTEFCCMILTNANISPEECVRTAEDTKYMLLTLVSMLLWPVTLPIGLFMRVHK